MERQIAKAAVGLVLSVVVLAVGSCIYLMNSFVSREEITRVRSPSGRAEAYLVEINGGATTSYGHDLFLHRVGDPLKIQDTPVISGYRVLNGRGYGMDLRWRDARTLDVTYETADTDLTGDYRANVGDDSILVRVRKSRSLD